LAFSGFSGFGLPNPDVLECLAGWMAGWLVLLGWQAGSGALGECLPDLWLWVPAPQS